MIAEHNGQGQGDGATRTSAGDPAVPPSAARSAGDPAVPPSAGTPAGSHTWPDAAAWPGAAALAQEAGTETSSAEPGTDVPFWDWAPAEDPADARSGTDEGPAPAGQEQAQEPAPAAIATTGPAFEDLPPRAEGIGHRLGSLDHIFRHSRMGVWRLRAGIAIVVGLVFTLLLNWQIGLTLAILAAIADTIIRSRVTVATPAPGVRKPTKPQRLTQKQLARLEKSGYKALHSRLIPDSDDHIDHLVAGPAGIFSVDSEWWDKHLPIRAKRARQLWLGPFSMKERLEHARWESEQASELLSAAMAAKVTVRPAMAIYGPKIPWDVMTIRDVDVFSGKRLRTYLRRYARHNTARPLTPQEIDRVLLAAHTAFPHLDHGVLAPAPAGASPAEPPAPRSSPPPPQEPR